MTRARRRGFVILPATVNLRRSRDGKSWEECAAPANPAAAGPKDRKSDSVQQIWALESGGRKESRTL